MPRAAATSVLRLIRDLPDFPREGILFRDLTPVLADGGALREIVDELTADLEPLGPVDAVVGVEARGFMLAGAIATRLGCGVVPLRKAGRLPAPVLAERYDLEYGSDALEFPQGVLAPGSRVLIVDDVLATGGTMSAATRLVERSGLRVAALAVVLEIGALAGRAALGPHPLRVIVTG